MEEERVDRAVGGDAAALEELISGVQDMVFNLSLRMLGTIPDAEDATQEILIKAMTRLDSFRRECTFSTWVFRIAVNHLKNDRKSMFAQRPLSFECYGEDIRCGREGDVPDLSQGVDAALLEEELKLSCTNVMLQCLSAEDRWVFVLGTMFHADSRMAGELLDMKPEAYRQRLSRTRRRMAEFLGEYCGLAGGTCRCARRINYAVQTRRLDPRRLEYSALEERKEPVLAVKEAMERVDEYSILFENMPAYRTTNQAREFLRQLLHSGEMRTLEQAKEAGI